MQNMSFSSMTQEVFQKMANATVQVYDGENEDQGLGSGFHLESTEIVVTNAHVVAGKIHQNESVYARTEEGKESELELLDYSPDNQNGHDFAILKTKSDLGDDRISLSPDCSQPSLGDELLFAGYPHGISNRLIQTGHVAGSQDGSFLIDGSINSGNSGGPVVDKKSGDVIGIVTYKRFVSPDEFEDIQSQWLRLYQHLNRMGSGGVKISGIDFGGFAGLMLQSFDVMNEVLALNSNTGIGGFQPIEHANGTLSSLSY